MSILHTASTKPIFLHFCKYPLAKIIDTYPISYN